MAQDLDVIVIGDKHVARDTPGARETELTAGLINKMRPDVVVQIGDWGTFDSVSRWDPAGSRRKKKAPTLDEDILSVEADVSKLTSGLAYQPHLHVTYGNHEDRVHQWAHKAGEIGDRYPIALRAAFTGHGWTVSDYNKDVFFGGVGFTHWIGGRSSGLGALRNVKRGYDLVHGHTHTFSDNTLPFAGLDRNGVRVISAGFAAPHGRREHYDKRIDAGWCYGLTALKLRAGRISVATFLPWEEVRAQAA